MILVFGKTGQVARELRLLSPGARFLGRDEADLTDPAACAAAIRAIRPAAVINAAAWTAVDLAEQNEDIATCVNATAPGAMARACAALDIPFVHISSDYVFDGAGCDPFAPEAATAPLGAYGRSKRAGEEAVRAANGCHAILRTSWVFSAHGANFLRTILRLGRGRDDVSVVADQIGGPTPADAIATACLTIAHTLIHDPTRSGTYHLAGAPDVSWAEFARAIMDEAALPCRVADIPASAYPTPARRPANSRLDCSGLAAFGLSRPDWRAALSRIIPQIGDPA
ncbi:dTDP-4-dehydrorhamnose reductase [Sedimentimonas flavescens]|uniref:dTDP-4-dehydrorhamnose reductase n=1 Tax=Sedimentimonas flavescens TaxID=2851012 RepID=A0ABT2ZZ01_9RHOB|nr:dTDP-4-dehydrorhamnose reductase [Sedimentimonas flavescens]MCV2878989.1 dTDP-4-dehydrorhamnose reductase [Sedimentimonas flavescens]